MADKFEIEIITSQPEGSQQDSNTDNQIDYREESLRIRRAKLAADQARRAALEKRAERREERLDQREADRREDRRMRLKARSERLATRTAKELERMEERRIKERRALAKQMAAEERKQETVRRRFINDMFGAFNFAHMGRRVNHAIDFMQASQGKDPRVNPTVVLPQRSSGQQKEERSRSTYVVGNPMSAGEEFRNAVVGAAERFSAIFSNIGDKLKGLLNIALTPYRSIRDRVGAAFNMGERFRRRPNRATQPPEQPKRSSEPDYDPTGPIFGPNPKAHDKAALTILTGRSRDSDWDAFIKKFARDRDMPNPYPGRRKGPEPIHRPRRSESDSESRSPNPQFNSRTFIKNLLMGVERPSAGSVSTFAQTTQVAASGGGGGGGVITGAAAAGASGAGGSSGLIGSAARFLLSPVGLLAVAVTATTAAFWLLNKAATKFGDFISDVPSKLSFAKAESQIRLFGAKMERAAKFGDQLADLEMLRSEREIMLGSIFESVMRPFLPLVQMGSRILNTILATLDGILGFVSDAISIIPEGLANIYTRIEDVGNAINEGVAGLLGKISADLEKFYRDTIMAGAEGKEMTIMKEMFQWLNLDAGPMPPNTTQYFDINLGDIRGI